MPKVTAMASVPPATMRATARERLAPPSRALTTAVRAKTTTTTAKVSGTRMELGGSRIAARGNSAPRLKEMAEASAAFQGLVRASGSMPSSASAWAL
jgi:hypothetical protein